MSKSLKTLQSRSSRTQSPTPSVDNSGTSTPNPSAITVTAQQSRFHADAFDAPESKEIDIKDLTLSIAGLEILSHAQLRLREGTHYVFAGRNGTGKSTLLKALAERMVPGVPSNLRILLLGQTRIEGEQEGAGEGRSVLEYVVSGDERRERAVKEAKLLSDALEDSNHPMAAVRAVRLLTVERVERELDEARLIAARRSGARGLKARQAVIAKEGELDTAKERLAALDTAPNTTEPSSTTTTVDPAPQPSTEEDLAIAITLLESTRLTLTALDAPTTESRAHTVLLGLGFSAPQITGPYTSLSGGWRTRASLASALVQRTDILLLDEPTNFLDLPAVIWLQTYLTSPTMSNTTVVVVTHDLTFADAVAESLLLLRLNPAKTLETFAGTLSDYNAEKRRQIRRMGKMKAAADRKTAHMEATIEKSVKAAKRTGDDKKLKQAASRRKKLDERSGLEVSASGGRFKLNRDRAGWHNSNRGEIEIPDLDPPVSIVLPAQPEPLRFPGPLVSFEKVCYSYPSTSKKVAAPLVLQDIDLTIHAADRVGLAGLNGSGKSTLIKLLMGAATASPPSPTKGGITTHSKARFGYYSQHAVEELEALGIAQPSLTALAHLRDVTGGAEDESSLRGTLAKLGLKGPAVSDVPLRSLSGGQRVRLALAVAMHASPHLLVLDEVTTHLDADTISALIEVLREWEGALLVVTHDRHFMRCVVEGEREDEEDSDSDEEDRGRGKDGGEERAPGRVYRLLKNGTMKKLERGMGQYEEIVQRGLVKLGILPA